MYITFINSAEFLSRIPIITKRNKHLINLESVHTGLIFYLICSQYFSTVFSNCISQQYSSNAFVNSISWLYFSPIFLIQCFPTVFCFSAWLIFFLNCIFSQPLHLTDISLGSGQFSFLGQLYPSIIYQTISQCSWQKVEIHTYKYFHLHVRNVSSIIPSTHLNI